MNKLALAALVALASTSAHSAVVLSFTGTDSSGTGGPVSGTITIDPAKLPVNQASGGDLLYYSSTDDTGYFISVVLNGTALPRAGAAGDNTIQSHAGSTSDDPSTISFTTETDSGMPSQDTYGFSIYSYDQIPVTTAFGGVALPDFRQAFANGDLSFSIEHYGYQNSNYSFQNGQVTSLSYAETAAAVPEPASWAMMVAGFGLVGGMVRRRQAGLAAA